MADLDVLKALSSLEQQLLKLNERQEKHILLSKELAEHFAARDTSAWSFAQVAGDQHDGGGRIEAALPLQSRLNGESVAEDDLSRQEPKYSSMSSASMSSASTTQSAPEVVDDFTWRSWFKRQVESNHFELFFAVLIVMNTVAMAAEQQYWGHMVGHELDFPSISEPQPWAEGVFLSMDKVFSSVFAVELCLRMAAMCSLRFFCSVWNCIDFLVVIVSMLHTASQAIAVDAKIMRLFRLMKLTRLLRVVKLGPMLEPLQLIVKSVNACWSTLFWSMTILVGTQWICGMLIWQLVFPYLQDESNPAATRAAIFRYYGTFTKTMITMFEVTHVNYSRASRTLSDNVSEHFAWFFILYRIVVSFACLQVIRAVFIQQTLHVANIEEHVKEKARKKQEQRERKRSGRGSGMRPFLSSPSPSRGEAPVEADLLDDNLCPVIEEALAVSPEAKREPRAKEKHEFGDMDPDGEISM